MHVLRDAEVGPARVRLDPGRGSAPDCDATLHPGAPGDGWKAGFATWRDFLAHAVPQDRAMSTQPGRVTRQEIDLGIPLEACEPLAGTVTSRAAAEIAGDAEPFCFRVATVNFLFDREEHDPLPESE